jgi:hypothetical protein
MFLQSHGKPVTNLFTVAHKACEDVRQICWVIKPHGRVICAHWLRGDGLPACVRQAACILVDLGADPYTIDKVIAGFGMPMGPFRRVSPNRSNAPSNPPDCLHATYQSDQSPVDSGHSLLFSMLSDGADTYCRGEYQRHDERLFLCD